MATETRISQSIRQRDLERSVPELSASITTSRTARISPDRRGVGISVIVLVAVIMAAGCVFSFATIADAASWAGVPEGSEWVRFTAPIFIDGAIITYTTAYAVHQWRREIAHARYARRILYFFTIVSVLVNGAHAASFWLWDFTRYEAWVGVLIAIMAPIASLFSAEQMIKLAFEQGAEADPSQVVPQQWYPDGLDFSDLDLDAADSILDPQARKASVTQDPGAVSPVLIAPEYFPEYGPEIPPDFSPAEPFSADAFTESHPSPLSRVFEQPLVVDHNGLFVVPGREAA